MNVSDLTPDALAKLEAKLMSDLDMVRKVRALLEEHQVGGSATANSQQLAVAPVAVAAEIAPTAVASVPGVPTPLIPQKSLEERMAEAVRVMPPEGFVLGMLKQALRKTGMDPLDSGVKTAMGRLIRQGRVMVVQSATGRIGNTYRYVPTAEELAERAAMEGANAPTNAENAGQSTQESGSSPKTGNE